jgi:bifunctional non-homologous end joining protein LigD
MPARTKSDSKSAKAVDRQLERYRSMRDFHITAEPKGGTAGKSMPASGPLPFVVQKHAATRLHYDFRLGWRGVLKSWAVTKGPSYFPGDKRLAVEVEDHPMEYGGFEGTIPKGQYGGGTVMVWDFGEWKGLGDVDKELEKGNLKFELDGTKLKGKWALVRMKPRPNERSDKPNWLLLKERDEWAQPEDGQSITDEAPDSAVTHRTMEEIAASKDHVWDSKQGLLVTENDSAKSSAAPLKSTTKKKPTAQARKSLARALEDAPREAFPGFIQPQLAQQARSVPNGDEWVHELKLDGYRLQVHVRSKDKTPAATLFTRNGLDWTHRMRALARAASELPVEDCILDGEVVSLDATGSSNFSDLQAAFQEGKHVDLVYFAFDILHLNGHNLRKLPLLKRKEILSQLYAQVNASSPLRLSDHIEGRGSMVFAKASELGAEGIVSKLATAPYTSGRGNAWLKMKCILEQEFVIGGYTLPEKGGRGIGALLLGYYDADKKLRYAGRCGTGFNEKTHRSLRHRLDPLVQKKPPFAQVPADAQRKVIWVKPELVAQVAFSTWTRDDLVRQSSFQGLREDKTAKEVQRESASSARAHEEASAAPAPTAPEPAASAPDSPPTKSSSASNGFRITHPRKVLDPQSGATKQQLADYYFEVAGHILPHIANRPLSVVRCPNGVGKPCFFQKHVSAGLPPGVDNVSIPNRKTGKKEQFLTIDSVEGLLGLAQLGALEIHPWGSTNDSIEKPDRIIFDLDPDEAIPWTSLAAAANDLRARLTKLKLTSFLKSTGGKGLHVVLPIQPEHEWPIIKQFSFAVVSQMEKSNPNLYLTKMTKAARANKIYLDYLRNDREATAIAPFSTRARPGIGVAVTLDWLELKSSARPAFHLVDFAQWKKRIAKDPWKAMPTTKQFLTAEMLRASGVKLT